MNLRFSDTETTDDGKTINVFVDEVMSRVELFRPAESTGNSGWSVIDCGSGDRVAVVEGVTLAEARQKAMEYLSGLEEKGENLYYAEDDSTLDDEAGEGETASPADDTGSSGLLIGGDGQMRMFGPKDGVPLDAEYTDERYEQAKKRLEKAKADLSDALAEKKRAGVVAKAREANYHHCKILSMIEEARIQSVKIPGQAFVPINNMDKLKVVRASEVRKYDLHETNIYQAFAAGMPVDLEDAVAVDLADKEAAAMWNEAGKASVDTDDGAEHEYRCARFERETVVAVDQEAAMTEMKCSPEDENAGCFGCEGPIVIEDQADAPAGTNATEDEGLPGLPSFEGDGVDDLPPFGDEGEEVA